MSRYPSAFEKIRAEHLAKQAREAGTPELDELRRLVREAGEDFGPFNRTTSILIQPCDYVATDGEHRKCWRVFNVRGGDGCDFRDFDTGTFLRVNDDNDPIW